MKRSLESIDVTDLCLATTLSLFVPIINVDKSNPRKVVFTFVHNDEITKLIDSYWKDDLRLSPIKFYQQLKIMKSRLYDQTK